MPLQSLSLNRTLQQLSTLSKIMTMAFHLEMYCCVNTTGDLSVGCSCIAVITRDEGEDL